MSDAVRIRASGFGRLLDCAYAWEGINLLGMRGPTSFRAHLGTSIHRSTAVFDQSRVEGAGLTPDETSGVFVDHLRRETDDVDMAGRDITLDEAERIGLTLHNKYCEQISPQFDYMAVEIEAEPLEIKTGESVDIVLTGTMDRQRIRGVEGRSGIAITDVKTGKRAANKNHQADTKGHQVQLGVYELLAEFSLNKNLEGPATVIGLQTAGKCHTGIAEIERPSNSLIGTEDEPGLIQIAAKMLSAGVFPPNPKSILCHPKYCPRWDHCIFHD